MQKSWLCCGTKELRHPITENHGDSCTLPSCPNKRPIAHRIIPWIPGIASAIGLFLVVSIAKALIPTPSPILFLHILDRSASAVNAEDNEAFVQGVYQTCDAIADSSKPNFDSSVSVLVDSIAIAPNNQALIQSKDDFRQDCKASFKVRRNNLTKGTSACDGWIEAVKEFDVLSDDKKPILITQIHANENEEFCHEVVLKMSSLISKANGFHIVIGSTNEGFEYEGFNSKLKNIINKSNDNYRSRTRFIDSSNPELCIKNITKSIRYEKNLKESDIRC